MLAFGAVAILALNGKMAVWAIYTAPMTRLFSPMAM
jgi:hypothetical protein